MKYRRLTIQGNPRTVARAAATAILLAAVLVSGWPASAGADGAATSQRAPAGTRIVQPTAAQLEATGLDRLPLAPNSRRVDLVAPPFSNSAEVTNPLFPISDLHSAVLNGRASGKPFKAETTLLPDTRIIEWTDGQPVEVLVSQYVAFLDGRIEEVALDFYAQAGDGSVWYLGEDVFNYSADGIITDTEGTWLAGKEGPAAMIMPAKPRVGHAFRPENIPGLVFEEVAITETGKIVEGPRGAIDGAIVSRELHADGSFSDKVFAPGYGEFYSAHAGDVEALAVAAPGDALSTEEPQELITLSKGADRVFGLAAGRKWSPAAATVARMERAWKTLRANGVPPRLVPPMIRALSALKAAVVARNPQGVRGATIDLALAATDLELQYRPVAAIDLDRFELWARRLIVDATGGDAGGVTGDLATLEWIRDRFVAALDPLEVTRIDQHLLDLRGYVADEDLAAAAAEAARLRATLASTTIAP